MKATIYHEDRVFNIDFSKPIDLSIPLSEDRNPLAWYIDPPKFNVVTDGDWIGRVAKGGDVNFTTLTFNPHSHCTHTETAGHITEKIHSVNSHLKTFFFMAEVVTLIPEPQGEDLVLTDRQCSRVLLGKNPEALIIRTLPNTRDKRSKNWSNTNWPYLEPAAMKRFRESGIKHLLVDLPSVDKEKDGGALLAHRTFWDLDNTPRLDATITEMVYVPHEVEDGSYLLNLQIAPFENDAAPSKPILYALNT